MISVNHLSFGFPNKELYEDISFTIEPGQSCALIGSSGSGKSTLAAILRGAEPYPYDGDVEIPTTWRTGYISQHHDVDAPSETTVFQYIARKFIALEEEIADLCAQMEETSDLDALLARYQEALDTFDSLDGDNYASNIEKQLRLADLYHCRDLSVAAISGGEFKLVQVIAQMLSTPDFIIMDEPDAFLDFDNLNALKHLLNNHKGTVLVITHSRYLLNHCFDKILHLENHLMQEFDGTYLDYTFALLSGKVEQMELAKKDTDEIDRNNELIDRLRDAAEEVIDPAKGRALKARMKVQERLEARRILPPFLDITKPAIVMEALEFQEEGPILTVDDLSISFEEPLLEQVSFTINPTEKVAIIGKNGTGKTTLLRTIQQGNHPAIHLHPEANVAYLSQDQQDILKPDETIYDAFFDLGFPTYDSISDYLSAFGFPLDKMKAKIATLSGGEKNILGLAKVCHQKANFLMLDEPVSHLDTYAQTALEEALKQYNGGILMISHDFYSIVNAMDYVLLIENKTLRKIRMRKFRKMIYAQHFDKDYLLLEQEKNVLEQRVHQLLHDGQITKAKEALEPLAELIVNMETTL